MRKDDPNDRQYDDIINLPHYQPSKHPHMSLHDRAAQFSPFAALTGHDASTKETARLTDQKVELDESEKEYLSDKFKALAENIEEHPKISITYFLKDKRKTGGSYAVETGIIKKD